MPGSADVGEDPQTRGAVPEYHPARARRYRELGRSAGGRRHPLFPDGPTNQDLAADFSDFEAIKGFVPWVYEQNRAHVAWLVRGGDIVVTHHLPSPRSVPATYEGDPTNVFFVCDMEKLIEKRQPALWIHGHTHESCSHTVSATTVLCNPRKYPGEENARFDQGRWPK
jgi:hypothetical protein